MIVLETALPAKFAATIVEALGREPDRPAALRGIEELPKRFTVMPADVAGGEALHRPEWLTMKVVGFTGYSGSGKTTLVEQRDRAPAPGRPAGVGGQARAPRLRHRPPGQGLATATARPAPSRW